MHVVSSVLALVSVFICSQCSHAKYSRKRHRSASYVQHEVWPPGSADTVCSRPPLVTQVQHFVSRIKKRQRWDVQTMWAYDLDVWPWRSSRLSVIRVLVLCWCTKCKFRSKVLWPTRDRHTMWPCDLDLWPWRAWRLWLMRVVVLHLYTKFEVRKPCHSEDMVLDVCQH